MSKIEVGRFSELLRKLLGMKGQQTVASELSPEISPVFVLEDDPPDLKFLKQVRLCCSADIAVAALGFFSRSRLRNPEGSGVIATAQISTLSHGETGGSPGLFEMFLITPTLDLAGIATGVVRDSRWTGGISGTTLRTSFQSIAGAASGSRVMAVTGGANATHFPTKFILLPGDGLDLQNSNPDQPLHFCWEWSERQLTALEE